MQTVHAFLGHPVTVADVLGAATALAAVAMVCGGLLWLLEQFGGDR